MVDVLLDVINMTARSPNGGAPKKPASATKKAVQVSFDRELLRTIDTEAKGRGGRSAFIVQAVLTFLRAKKEAEIDEQIRRAYEGHADELLADSKAMMDSQSWPPEDDLCENIPEQPLKRSARKGR